MLVTTNEDANPHPYVLTPGSSQAAGYTIQALPSKGGLDSTSFWKGMMLVSASAPGTLGKVPPQAGYPAVYVVTLNSGRHTASVRGLFGDQASATKANSGQTGTQLSTIKLSQSIDDTQWASGPSGTLYVTDGSADLIYKVTGPFQEGQQIAAVSLVMPATPRLRVPARFPEQLPG